MGDALHAEASVATDSVSMVGLVHPRHGGGGGGAGAFALRFKACFSGVVDAGDGGVFGVGVVTASSGLSVGGRNTMDTP